jgi:hypothetical protein
MIRAAALLCAMAAAPALGQELLPSPPLQPDVTALPRLAGNSPAIQKINAELKRLDEFDLEALTCYHTDQPENSARSVEVLSDGPEFLSLMISNSTYCAGTDRSWSEQKIVTFDLEAGETTKLHEYFPPSWGTAEHSEDLLSIYFINLVDDLPMDCVPAYARAVRTGYIFFDLGIAKAERALVLWPSGLAPVETPCLEAIHVPVDQLVDAGFHGKLIDALTPAP